MERMARQGGKLLGLGPRRPGAGRRWGAFSVAFLVVACAAQDSPAPIDQDLSLASRLFKIGYQDISEIYIEDIRVSELALAGLDGLTSIDPEMTAARVEERVSLSFGGEEAGNFLAPEPRDVRGWAALTAAALRIGRDHSTELGAAKPERLYEVVFDGVLSRLDRFSRYAGYDEAHENRASREGFGGIGVRIRLVDQGVRILSVMEDTPAERAGLMDNDIVTHIDDGPTVGMDQREVVRRLRGPLGTTVTLTTLRDDTSEPLSMAVVRAHIVPQTVRYARFGNFAHIRISGFNQSTTQTLREKIAQAETDLGPNLAGYVIDLRNNPGGLLDQAVAVSDLFITQGLIVSTHGRHADSHQYFSAEPDDLAKDQPVVVLVNGNSASASEIVAAALQDTQRAVVIGSASYGKGTVQTVLRLPNEGELTLTWARFHAPSGYALNRRGVMPDICTTGGVETVADVLDLLRAGRLPIAPEIRGRDIDPRDEQQSEDFRAQCPSREDEADIDLEVARRLLENPELFALAQGGDAPTTAGLGGQQRVSLRTSR